MTTNGTLEGEMKQYFVSGDFINSDGDIEFETRDYHAQNIIDAEKDARVDGLIRLDSTYLEGRGK